MRRIVILTALMMAVMVVLWAPMAEAKHRHHHRHPAPAPPAFNVVQCPTQSDGLICIGTASNDYLVGRDASDHLYGEEGNDVYDGKGGSDLWYDNSTTSSDYYLLSVQDFGNLLIQDDGGNSDTLDLSRFHNSYDFSYSRLGDNLFMDGLGTTNDVTIYSFFSSNSVDSFKFSDGTFTAQQVKDRVV